MSTQIPNLTERLRAKITAEMNAELEQLAQRQTTPQEVMAVREKYEAKLSRMDDALFQQMSGVAQELIDSQKSALEYQKNYYAGVNERLVNLDNLSLSVSELRAMMEAVVEFISQVCEGREDRLETASYLADATLKRSREVEREVDRLAC